MSEETYYEDPDTGELIPESQVDWSQYEVDEEKASGVGKFANRVAGEAFGGFLQGFGNAWGGGEQMIAENYPDLAEFLGADAEHGRQVAAAGRRLYSKKTDPYQFDTDTTSGYLADLFAKGVGGVGKLAPSFLGSYLVPPAAPALFGTQIGTETIGANYDEARQRGVEAGDAEDLALIRGGVDAAAGALVPGGSKASSLLRSIPKTALTLELFNTISEGTRSATEQGIVEDAPIDWRRVASETGENVLKSTPETLAMSPFFALASRASQRSSRPPESTADTAPIVPDVNAEVVQDVGPVIESVLQKVTQANPIPDSGRQFGGADILPDTSSRLGGADLLPDTSGRLGGADLIPDTSGRIASADTFYNRMANAKYGDMSKPLVEAKLTPADIAPDAPTPKLDTDTSIREGTKSFPDSVTKKDSEPVIPVQKVEPQAEPPIQRPFERDPVTGMIRAKASIYDIGDRVKEFNRTILKAPEDISDIRAEVKEQGGRPELVQYEHMASDLEKLFNGRLVGREVPVVKDAIGAFRKQLILPWKMAKRDSNVMDMWRLNKEKMHYENENAFELAQDAAPFFDLTDQSRVARAAYQIRERALKAYESGQVLSVTPDTLIQMGLTPSEAAAYQAVRGTLSKAWGKVEESVVENISRRPGLTAEQRAEKIANTKAFFKEKEDTHYVPIHRFGERYVYGKDPKTGQEWYSLHESRAEQKQAAANIALRGFKTKVGEVRKTQDAVYDNMPVELRFELSRLIEDPNYKPDFDVQGFKGHLLKAKLMPGYEKDLRRNLSHYITSMSSWVGKLKYDGPIDSALARIDPKSPVYQEAADWMNYIRRDAKEASWARSALGHYYLGMSPSSALLNLTQTMTTTWPQLRKYTKAPAKTIASAIRLRRFYHKDPTKFSEQHPELYNALELSKRRGETTDQMTKNLFDIGAGKDVDLRGNKKSWGELSMAMFSAAERINREVSLISAMKVAPKDAPFAKKVQFAEDFITNTQFDYTKMGRPKIARGWKAVPYTFRLFGHNYYSVLGDALREVSQAKTALKSGTMDKAQAQERLSTARAVRNRYGYSLGALGGTMAMPFVSQLSSVLAAQGIDLKKVVRDAVDWDDASNLILYGPTHALLAPLGLGFNLTGATAPGEQLAMEKGLGGAAEKLLLGVAGDAMKKPARAMTALEQTGSYRNAAEEIAPRAWKNVMQGVEAGVTGEHRSLYGDTLVKNVTPFEAALKSAGLNPSRFAEANEQYSSVKIIKENRAKEVEGLHSKYENAVNMIVDGNKEEGRARLKELWAYSQSIGHDPQLSRILRGVIAKRDPRFRASYGVSKKGNTKQQIEEVFDNFEDEEEEDE